MATILTLLKQFIDHSKMLAEDDIKNAQYLLPLTKLERKWIQLHDRYGHMSFTEMYKLVTNNMLTKKFQKLKGKKFICPSCAFGKM